ncbi:MAG: complex I subunit 1/NuoH family protein [Candidatus Asgardarchaeia archaeon]
MLDIVSEIFKVFIFPGIVSLILMAWFEEWVDRKFYADLQNRIGPYYAGPKGILQPVADFIKLLSKEDIDPRISNKVMRYVLPMLSFAFVITSLFFIPITSSSGILSLELDLVVVIFLMTLTTISFILAGWFSGGRFSSLGAIRLGILLLGYEIPLITVFLTVGIATKSLTIVDIVNYQLHGVPLVLQFPYFISFFLSIVIMQAELEKIPFDIPEAETEIVAGWKTEFSGKKLALITLTQDLRLLFSSAIISTIFLGGPYGPELFFPQLLFILDSPLSSLWLAFWFSVKVTVITLISSNIRALMARYRADQIIEGSWKYLFPMTLVLVALIEITFGGI